MGDRTRAAVVFCTEAQAPGLVRGAVSGKREEEPERLLHREHLFSAVQVSPSPLPPFSEGVGVGLLCDQAQQCDGRESGEGGNGGPSTWTHDGMTEVGWRDASVNNTCCTIHA